MILKRKVKKKMEIKLTVGFDKKAEAILEKLLNAFAEHSATQNYFNSIDTDLEGYPQPKEEIKAPKEPKKKPLDLAAPQAIEETTVKEEPKKEEKTTSVDYEAVRSEAKRIGMQLSQLKKSNVVKELNDKYGVRRITEVPDDIVEAYLADIRKILEEA